MCEILIVKSKQTSLIKQHLSWTFTTILRLVVQGEVRNGLLQQTTERRKEKRWICVCDNARC
jgi:2-C-methyl-D-erythritol 4-phosphate cytidylyltransferase